ncbi:hypothetical protein [Inquilinus sp. Marseille-Q2685]|uniref:hypothetical protein n=1 Tax=Inquilinus sp. Marseille-Q2685 TaxID=2866581 RepID=UPI001CE45F53|nr:hypothetical protein [Inquilinus sp. Marseille-Q2685]
MSVSETETLLSDPRFTISQAAAVAGVEPGAVRNWFQRGHLILADEDRKAMEAGYAHKLTLRRVLQIAIAAELVAFGISPSKAGWFAAKFTDLGEGDAGWEGEPSFHRPVITRRPGHLFNDGMTVLQISRTALELRAEVVNIHSKTNALSFFTKGGAVLLLDLTDLVFQVRAKLGLPR